MSKLREYVVSNCEKSFLLKCLKEHQRLDHRAFNEFRDISIEFGKDYGCCYVSLGKTKVLAQVSCEIQVPKSSRPSEGILNVNIELNPLAAPNFDLSNKTDLFTQLNRTLEKCIKDSKAIDLESLCIKMSEKAWAVRVDINVLNHEGNILDCASIAALSALCHFRRPDISCDGDEFVVLRYDQKDPIPLVIHHYPVCITYSIFERGEFILADPTLLEEGVADAFLNVGMNAYRELCGLHLGGKAELTPDVLIRITQMAGARAAIVVEQIKKAVESDNEKRLRKEMIGFHNSINKSTEIQEDLESCFDLWKTVPRKRKTAKQEKIQMEVDMTDDADSSGNNSSKIEQKGEGSAVLVPEEFKQVDEVWGDSSEEDNDEDVIEIPRKIQAISLIDSDSEEETTVVLNATKKKKRKGKSHSALQ
ncbi:exosome complex component RRP45 [Coccinella septempunctata]|uniref:exosome complex component RRP45 n=1 Tax=Coccinella septempunctata TaxID=41139 RepID=UPI001D06E0B8|nr:exosome complex component RRP45 [Coccinella septempunctata]